MTHAAVPFDGLLPRPTDSLQAFTATTTPSNQQAYLLQASYVLQAELKTLYYAAASRDDQNFKVYLDKAAHTAQSHLLALRTQDTAEWQGGDNHNFALSYLQASAEQRRRTLAWVYFARAAHLLPAIWGTTCARAAAITSKFRFLVGLDTPPATIHTFPDADSTGGLVDTSHGTSAYHTYRASEYLDLATLACPGSLQLRHALSNNFAGRISPDRKSIRGHVTPDLPITMITLPPRATEGHTRILLQGATLVAIHAARPLNHMLRKRTRQSAWQPDTIRATPDSDAAIFQLPDTHGQPWAPNTPPTPRPPLHVTNIVRRANIWRSMLGEHLDPTARLLIDGHAAYLLRNINLQGYERPNMPATNTPEAMHFIDTTVAKYLAAGVLTYCPDQCRPTCVSPLNVVPKKTAPFFRLVLDLRGANEFQDDWRSTMTTLAASAHIFQPGSYCWTRDIEAAYLITPLGGCRPGLHSEPAIGQHTRHYVGCKPTDCNGACSKAMLGIRWRNQYYRYEAPPFGAKQSGNILAALIEPYLRRLRDKGIHLLAWCDDIIMCLPPLPEHRHDAAACGGHDTCASCAATRQRAIALEAEVDREMDALGLFTNEKRQSPARDGEFIGLSYDTATCTFVLTNEKAASLAQAAATLATAQSASPRTLAKFRGKLGWYSPCVPGVRLLTRHVTAAIGAPGTPTEWDTPHDTTPAARNELSWWATNLPHMAGQARPMWELTGAQALDAFLDGSKAVDTMLITDASVHGWGALLHLRHGDQTTTSCTTTGRWPFDNDLDQAHREAFATPRALAAFRHLLHGRAIVHISDCLCVVYAQQAGSGKSPRLQQAAEQVYHEAYKSGFHITSAWIAGVEMVENGVDHLSREGAFDPHEVTITPAAWATVSDLAHSCGWELEVDWFADEHIAMLPAFWTQVPCGPAEGTDALQAPSWATYHCHHCNSRRTRAAWLFPPVPLLDRVAKFALRDQAYGIVMLPEIRSSPWWQAFQSARVAHTQMPPGHLTLGSHVTSRVYTERTWHAVAFDFRPQPAPPSNPPCQCPASHAAFTPQASHPAGRAAVKHLAYAQALLARHLLDLPDDTERRVRSKTGKAPT